MTAWSGEDLDQIAGADELVVAPLRGDGTPRGRHPGYVEPIASVPAQATTLELILQGAAR